MNIGCTKKLLDELKCKPSEGGTENSLFSWHANLITINRRKAVLIINDKSRYSVLLYGLKAANFKMFDKIIASAIKETLLAEGITSEMVEKYLKEAGRITITKTSNKSVVAVMNQMARVAEDYENDEYDLDNLNQTDYNLRMGQWIYTINGEHKYPREVLIEAMVELAQGGASHEVESIVTIKAFQFLISLDLQNQNVWRRVIVPADITFRKFHFAIQAAFGWQGYHLHEFTIFNNAKSVAMIACDEGALNVADDIDYPIKMDKKTKLLSYLPQCKKIEYVYDFGDGWSHSIELEKTIDNYPKNFAICVDGEGSCPPEDVGGEPGYENFLEAINNPNHPEHEEMLTWGKMQRYGEFNIKNVNFYLSRALIRRR